MKKVKNPVQQRFWEEEENRIVKSVLPPFNLTYEGLEYQEFSPVEGEEDWWFDDCLNQKNKRRSR